MPAYDIRTGPAIIYLHSAYTIAVVHLSRYAATMTLPSQPKSDALRRMYWRDELLQLLFWVEGEGFGSKVDAETIDRFLGGESEIALMHLDRLVTEGYLRRAGVDTYRLADRGRMEGRRLFAEEFADLTRPTHGECGKDCWCRQAPEEALICLATRAVG